MRSGRLFLWDIRFQANYGFYFLYAVLTAVYLAVLAAVPENWRKITAVLLIFSDPASMGLFFMGAIVLLEKHQRTPCALAVSPVRPLEYIIAKAGSLASVSLAVAAVLAPAAGVEHVPIVLSGTALSSVLFTLLGMIIATNVISLNQFLLWTVPVEVVCFVPAILHVFRITPAWFRYHPVSVCIDMISGRAPSVAGIVMTAALAAVLAVVSQACVRRMWESTGGVKL